jgi:hypothetical protein
MFTITVGAYAVTVQQGTLPAFYRDYKKRAKLCDEFSLGPQEAGELCFVSVSAMLHWPTLVVAQRFELAQAGFDPACLLVPESHTIFIGAGRRLLAYQLDAPRRLWEESVDSGFLEWSRHDQTVLMSGELELGAWDIRGQKLWTLPLEHTWEYHVQDGKVHLDAQGRRTVFGLQEGPQHAVRDRQ